MNSHLEYGHCDQIGEYVVTKTAIPQLLPVDKSFLMNDIELSMSIATEVSSELFAFSALVESLYEANKSLQGSLADPKKCATYVRGIDISALEVVAIRTKAKQKDWVDSDDLKEQAHAEIIRDKHLVASVLPLTRDHSKHPAAAEDVVALIKDSHHPDATRKALCTQILGKSVVVDNEQALCKPTEHKGTSVDFHASKHYVISFRIKDILENGSKAVVILEETFDGCPLFFNHDLGNREINLEIDSHDASQIFPICMHLDQPVSAKVQITLNASFRGLAYRGRFHGFSNSSTLRDAVRKKMDTVISRLI